MPENKDDDFYNLTDEEKRQREADYLAQHDYVPYDGDTPIRTPANNILGNIYTPPPPKPTPVETTAPASDAAPAGDANPAANTAPATTSPATNTPAAPPTNNAPPVNTATTAPATPANPDNGPKKNTKTRFFQSGKKSSTTSLHSDAVSRHDVDEDSDDGSDVYIQKAEVDMNIETKRLFEKQKLAYEAKLIALEVEKQQIEHKNRELTKALEAQKKSRVCIVM